MTIAESTRLRILELKSQGMSIREIAAETGVGKNTVDRVLKEDKNGDRTVPKIVTHGRARATKSVSPKCPQKMGTENGDKMGTVETPRVTVMEARTITRDLTISELFDLLQTAKEDLALARRNNDGSKDAVMAVSASTKVVTEILKQMGKWCGLDDTLTGESKRDTVGRADIENMSLDEMRELVRDL